MIHSIKPSYAVKVVHSRVHLLIADTFSETSQNTVKTLKNHLWIVDTYLVDVAHNRHLFMQQITTCPVFSGDETGFDAFFAKKKYWARKLFFHTLYWPYYLQLSLPRALLCCLLYSTGISIPSAAPQPIHSPITIPDVLQSGSFKKQ